MERYLKGIVLIIRFPFSNLTGSKKRPALIVADWGGDDVILAQITSVAYTDKFAVNLNTPDFTNGSLHKESFIRPNKLFTADRTTLLNSIGTISIEKMKEITDAICSILL
jgi:mRNA interferase MazF